MRSLVIALVLAELMDDEDSYTDQQEVALFAILLLTVATNRAMFSQVRA